MFKKITKISNALDAYGENRGCPICSSIHNKLFLELDGFQFYTDPKMDGSKQFSIRQNICLDCSSLYMNPVYSDFGFKNLFNEAGKSYGALPEHIDNQILWLSENGLLELQGSILDVGCFDGEFLSKIPGSIFKYGVDFDDLAIQRARNKFHPDEAKFFSGSFDSIKYDSPPPSLITMFHVLEHLPYPIDVLKKLRSISNEKTKLVIEVPVLEEGITNDINGFFSIQHTTHFSKNSLKNCLLQSGWCTRLEYSVPDYNGYRVVANISDIAQEEIN